MPKICSRAVALLPEQHGRAERRGHRDDVEQHRLDGQQDRAERAHQQDERHERDQPEAVGELLVDRADVVEHGRARRPRCRRRPGTSSSASETRVTTCALVESTVSSVGDHGDERGAVLAPLVVVGGEGRGDPVDARARASTTCAAEPAGSEPLTSTSIGETTPAGHAAVAQRLQRLVGRAATGQRVGLRLADLDAEDRDDQRGEDHQRDAGRDPAPAHDQPRPGRPGAGRSSLVPDARPVDLGADACPAAPAAGSGRPAC